MYPPLSKGLWGCYGRRLFSGNTLKVSKPLAFITFLHIFLHILLHGGLVVACFDNFVDQGPRVYVVSADSFVDLSRIYFASSSSTHLRYGMEKPFLYRVSFRIVNLAARFLTFLASSVSTGRHPSHRKERIGFIFWFWITKV